jgi:hypothetical protein
MSDTEPTPSLINPNSMNTRSATVAGARRVYRRYWAGSVPSLGGNLEPPNLLNLQLSATSTSSTVPRPELIPGFKHFLPDEIGGIRAKLFQKLLRYSFGCWRLREQWDVRPRGRETLPGSSIWTYSTPAIYCWIARRSDFANAGLP